MTFSQSPGFLQEIYKPRRSIHGSVYARLPIGGARKLEGRKHAARYHRCDQGCIHPGQKKDLIAKVTQAMIDVEGENMRPVTWVRINEFESGDWAIGGKPLRTSDVQALAAGKAA